MTVILFTRQAVIGLIASISLFLAFQPQVADATEKMPFSLEDVLEWRQLGSPAERADVMIGLGNNEAAVQLLKQWQPTNPTDWVALHRSIAHVFQAIGQPEKALAYLEDAQTLLEHKDGVTWRSLIDVQLTSRHWSAAEKSLSDPQFAALASTKERRAWRELLNALRSVDQLVDWRRALEAWQALAVDSPAMLPIARHLIGAQQGEVIDHFLSKDDAQKRSPQWATVVALRAHQNGHTDTSIKAYEEAADGFKSRGDLVQYLTSFGRSRQLMGEVVRLDRVTKLPVLNIAESPDMRLTRRGAFLQDSVRPAPYFQPSSPNSFERFPFPAGTSVRGASGVVIDGGRRVLTNRHVVDGGADFAIRTGLGEVSKARVVFRSETDDLAILELDSPLPAARAINLDDLHMAQPGSQVVAMGYPLWYLLGSQTPSLTNGVVAKASGINEDPKMFQMTAKINRGNSGGPVFDMRGRLVGLTMGKIDSEALRVTEGSMPEDINFAIQADRMLAVITGGSSSLFTTSALPPVAVKPPEQIYRDMLGRVVIVAVAVK